MSSEASKYGNSEILHGWPLVEGSLSLKNSKNAVTLQLKVNGSC